MSKSIKVAMEQMWTTVVNQSNYVSNSGFNNTL